MFVVNTLTAMLLIVLFACSLCCMVCTIRGKKALENRFNKDDDRIETLERQVRQYKELAEEADRKYEEVGVHAQNVCLLKNRSVCLVLLHGLWKGQQFITL